MKRYIPFSHIHGICFNHAHLSHIAIAERLISKPFDQKTDLEAGKWVLWT
jgi:hypothetical protein